MNTATGQNKMQTYIWTIPCMKYFHFFVITKLCHTQFLLVVAIYLFLCAIQNGSIQIVAVALS